MKEITEERFKKALNTVNLYYLQLKERLEDAELKKESDRQSIIRDVVEWFFDVDIMVKSRKRQVIKARTVYYTLMKKYTEYTLKRIAINHNRFEKQDHSTVIHAIEKIKADKEWYFKKGDETELLRDYRACKSILKERLCIQ